jgi:hypothetical protein
MDRVCIRTLPGTRKITSHFPHLKPAEKDYERSDSGGLFMLVTKTGSKLWRYAYRFDAKQKLLAIGQYPLRHLAWSRCRRGTLAAVNPTATDDHS